MLVLKAMDISNLLLHLFSIAGRHHFLISHKSVVVRGLNSSFIVPKAFANYDSLSSNSALADFSKDSERDVWEYCSDLAEQPKGPCSCSCHDSNNNANSKESSTIRHCINCNLKVPNTKLILLEREIN